MFVGLSDSVCIKVPADVVLADLNGRIATLRLRLAGLGIEIVSEPA